MWAIEEHYQSGWFKARFKRQFSELVRIALPTTGMRLGMMALGLIDTAMVGHYATSHLAWLNLANQSLIMFTFVVALGLLMGVMVFTSNAFGAKDYKECGRVWRRTLPFAGLIGLAILLITIPAPYILTGLGQSPDIIEHSGRIIQILGIGMPGHVLFITCFMFLEGIKRPEIGLKVMIIANLVNIPLNWILIYGTEIPNVITIPALGAEGSAWTTAVVRWVMGLSMFAYIWFSPSLQKFGIRISHGQKWSDWSDQRQLGYASGLSMGAEVIAFSAIAIYAGWLGTVPLAAQGVINQVNGLPLMIAIGLGGSGSVRVGIAFARRDRLDTIMAVACALLLHFISTLMMIAVVVTFPLYFIGLFTNDAAVISLLSPLVWLFVVMMFFDGAQMMLSSCIRGMKEAWAPTIINGFCFICVMLPVCYLFAFVLNLGLAGLFWGTLLGVFLSYIIQIGYLAWRTRKGT